MPHCVRSGLKYRSGIHTRSLQARRLGLDVSYSCRNGGLGGRGDGGCSYSRVGSVCIIWRCSIRILGPSGEEGIETSDVSGSGAGMSGTVRAHGSRKMGDNIAISISLHRLVRTERKVKPSRTM